MTAQQLQLNHHEVDPGVVVITLSGKLMLGRESEQVTTLVPELLERGSHGIIFDIAGLTRVDSTGIGRFISSYNRIEEAGAKMAIVGPTSHLRECFRATQLDRIFAFYNDVPAARAAMSSAERQGA